MSKQLCRPPKVHLYLKGHQRNENLQLVFICSARNWNGARRGSRVKTTVRTSESLLLLEHTEG